jgi:hypothetical protein
MNAHQPPNGPCFSRQGPHERVYHGYERWRAGLGRLQALVRRHLSNSLAVGVGPEAIPVHTKRPEVERGFDEAEPPPPRGSLARFEALGPAGNERRTHRSAPSFSRSNINATSTANVTPIDTVLSRRTRVHRWHSNLRTEGSPEAARAASIAPRGPVTSGTRVAPSDGWNHR